MQSISIFREVSIVERMKTSNSEQVLHRVGFCKVNCSFKLEKSFKMKLKVFQSLAIVRQYKEFLMKTTTS